MTGGNKWGASVARCAPDRRFPLLLPGVVQPRYCRCNLSREAVSYAAIASASLSLALMSVERFYGAFRPGEKHRLSTHVDPGSAPSCPAEALREGGRDMVEPPGTAPGSAVPIARRRLSP